MSSPQSQLNDRGPWLFLLAGSLLRVVWPLDMEWKFDEKWMFAKGLSIATGKTGFPALGMSSGVGLRNPGMSVWPFGVLAFFTHDPVAMAQLVQGLNVLVLWLFALWVMRTWDEADRALGLWGVALFAVSPLAVLFSRKIWAQDVLIAFVLPWLWSHRRRQHAWGAAAWGFSGALLGQVHMSGLFAGPALFAATLWRDRRHFRWLPWLIGSAIGALPLLPWLRMLLTPSGSVAHAKHFSLRFLPEAMNHAFGLGLIYPLGLDFLAFLKGPTLFGAPTYLAGALHVALIALFGFGIYARLRRPREPPPEPIRLYTACVLLTGLLLFALRVDIYAHYLIVFGPVLHCAAIWLIYPRRRALIAACALQLLLSASFLTFVHERGGAPRADYGKTYRTQTPDERRLDAP